MSEHSSRPNIAPFVAGSSQPTIQPSLSFDSLDDWIRDRIGKLKRQQVKERVTHMRRILSDAFLIRNRHSNPVAIYSPGTSFLYRGQNRYDPMWLDSVDMRKKFGRDYKQFLRPFFQFQIQKGDFSQSRGETKAYWLNEQTYAKLKSLWTDPTLGRPTDANTGRVLTSEDFPLNGVFRTSFSSASVPSLIPIDIERLNETIQSEEDAIARKEGSFIELPDRAKTLRVLYGVRQYTEHLGGVPNLYRDYEVDEEETQRTGRLSAVGDINLQQLFKPARHKLYRGTGWWDYDFTRCHPTILNSMCQGLGIEFDVLDDYLANREERNEQLAEVGQIKPSKFKLVINGLIYGQSLANNPNNELWHTIGPNAIRALQQDIYFVWLYSRMREVTKEIIMAHTDGSDIVNAVGKRKALIHEGEKARSSTLLAHILQGMEAFILNVAVRDSEDILVLMHDGFVCREVKTISVIEERIQEETRKAFGYPVQMKLKGVQM